MKNYNMIILLILLSGCNYTFDKKDPIKVGEAIHKSFSTNNIDILRQAFKHNMDSIDNNTSETVKKIGSIFQHGTKPTKIRIDTTDLLWWKNIDLYYKTGETFYRIRALYNRDSTGVINIDDIYLTNLNETCDNYNNIPYCPTSSIVFKNLSWNTDYYERSFKRGSVTLQNNTGQDLNYIKFRVVLKNGKYSLSAETFLTQTIESYKPIYSKDIVSINIPGMENYYAGFTIKQSELFFNAELIEVRPKPESSICVELEKLKNDIIKNAK